MTLCSAVMLQDRAAAAAGDRGGPGHRHRGRLPTGRELRPRRCVRGGAVRDAGREYRPVLLDPDGGAVAQCFAPSTRWRLLLTGDAISAEDAARIGLVNRVVAPGTERDEALALAHKIAAKSRHVVKIGKEAFYRQIDMDLARAYDYAAEVMVENMMARDAAEGISAFIEKRAARWEDR